jgi:abequosyltransferase
MRFRNLSLYFGVPVTPFLSVCIPAYNRASLLGPLLDSLLQENRSDCEIVIAEDQSPERDAIRAVVETYQSKGSATRIRYFENESNFGYDRNLRALFSRAEGEYCLFMGNDDLLAAGGLGRVVAALQKHDGVGVIMRSYAAFEGHPDNIVQEYRYFDSEKVFPAGPQTSALFFRRCVVISGLTIHRASAVAAQTDEFDGTLLYQLHTVLHVLWKMKGLFLPEILTLYRNGGVPDFGNSEVERARFTPQDQTPESSLAFIEGMLRIAHRAQEVLGQSLYAPIFRDLGNYSLPVLAIQAQRPKTQFLSYGFRLAKMGFWRNAYFWAFFGSLFVLGPKWVNQGVVFIKRRLGYTPALGFSPDAVANQSP